MKQIKLFVLVATVTTAALHAMGSSQPIVGVPSDAIPVIDIPELDWAALHQEDASRDLGLPPRFAIPHEVRVTPQTDGVWERIDNRTLRWSLRVRSDNAISMNLGFRSWALPQSASMELSSIDETMAIRPFTSFDNKDHGELWTPVLPGSEILVEIYVSTREQKFVNEWVELTSINVGYRGFYEQGISRSGSCNVDVVCSEGDDWRDEIPCVAVISTGGSTFCTGFMVNNTSQDRTPYFMTANHCGVNSGNDSSLVTYWNYENSYCRVPGSGDSGGSGDGQLNQFNTGATHLTSGSASDYTLVILDDEPQEEWEISYCGWDARGLDGSSAVAIHQPSTDEKRISFEYQATTMTSYLGKLSPVTEPMCESKIGISVQPSPGLLALPSLIKTIESSVNCMEAMQVAQVKQATGMDDLTFHILLDSLITSIT